MKSQLRQVIFLSLFWLLCCIFVFFVPWRNSTSEEQSKDPVLEVTSSEKILEEESDLPELTGKLVFLVDEKVKNPHFMSFLSWFSQKNGIEIDLITRLSGDQKADIFLFPYDQLEFISSPLRFSQDLNSYFLTGVHEILNKDGFIPYGIDPLIAYSLPGLIESEDIIQTFQNRKPERGSASFLFWPYQDSQFYDQNLVFALMLNDFVKYNDYGAFHSWLDMLASPDLRKQEFQFFQKIPECEWKVLSCLIKKWFLAYGFAFASQTQFDKEFKTIPYPYNYEGAPVRIYGFMISESSPLRRWAEMLIGAYLQLSDSDIARLTSQSGFLSVFPSVYIQQCRDLCLSLEKMRILRDSKLIVEELFNDFWFKKLEQKKLNPDLYLERALL